MYRECIESTMSISIEEAKKEIVGRCERLLKASAGHYVRVVHVFTSRSVVSPNQAAIWIRGTRIEDEVDFVDLVTALYVLRRHMVLDDLAAL